MTKIERAGEGSRRSRSRADTQGDRRKPSLAGVRRSKASAAISKSTSASAPIKASLELALLGLIAESRAVSGYDLVKTFDASMAHYWHALHGQIYPTLDRMRAAGFIDSRDVIQRGRPNKRLYSITAAGRAMLLKWLLSPAEPFKIKHAPLLRTRFLGHLGAQKAGEKLLEDRELCAKVLETYRGFERKFSRSGRYHDVNTMFTYFTLRYGIMFTTLTIEFCNWAIEEITRNPELFRVSVKTPDQARPQGGGSPAGTPIRKQSGEQSRVSRRADSAAVAVAKGPISLMSQLARVSKST
jgi:DNA-binding PadR family transcriptional regulator